MNGTESTSFKLDNETEVRTKSFGGNRIRRPSQAGESATKRQRVASNSLTLHPLRQEHNSKSELNNLYVPQFANTDFDLEQNGVSKRLRNQETITRSNNADVRGVPANESRTPTSSRVAADDNPKLNRMDNNSNYSESQLKTVLCDKEVEEVSSPQRAMLYKGAAVVHINYSTTKSAGATVEDIFKGSASGTTAIAENPAKETNEEVIYIDSDDDRDVKEKEPENHEAMQNEPSFGGGTSDLLDVDNLKQDGDEDEESDLPLETAKDLFSITPPTQDRTAIPLRSGMSLRRGSRCIEKRKSMKDVEIPPDTVEVYDSDSDCVATKKRKVDPDPPSQEVVHDEQIDVQNFHPDEELSKAVESEVPVQTNVMDDNDDTRKDSKESVESPNVEALAVEEEPVNEVRDSQISETLFRFPPSGKGNITVKYEDYLRLQSNEYLNDTLIDFYIKIIEYKQTAMAAASSGEETRLYFFTSFFFGRLRSNKDAALADIEYDGVKRWTKNVDLFQKELSFMPVCESSHWSLIILANMDELEKCMEEDEYKDTLPVTKRPRILYLDSLEPRRGQTFGRIMLYYLAAEFTERKSEDSTMEDRKEKFNVMKSIISVNWPYVPMQINEVDCGLYLLHNLNCFLDESTGMKNACLQDPPKDKKPKQPWMKALYTHTEVHLLRFQILQLIEQMEIGNKTHDGQTLNMPLLCSGFPNDAPDEANPVEDTVGAQPETQIEDDARILSQESKEKVVNEAAAIAVAIDDPRIEKSETPGENEDEVKLVSESLGKPAVEASRRALASNTTYARTRTRRSLSAPISPAIPPTMAYGSSPSPAVTKIGRNYRERTMSAGDGYVSKSGSRRHKEMPPYTRSFSEREEVIDRMDIDGEDKDEEMKPVDERGASQDEVIDVDGVVNMEE